LLAFSLPPGLCHSLSALVNAQKFLLHWLMHNELLHCYRIQALIAQWLIVVLDPDSCIASTLVAHPESSAVVLFPSLGFH
jgi:hypothetical protein